MVAVDQKNGSLRNQLEELFKSMLLVWAREIKAISLVSGNPDECDKKVLVRRVSGEFGFRIHGSRPVVVSAIEPGTPAETSGLEVGDIIINVNKFNVLGAGHSDVVKLAHGGPDMLELDVARTSNMFNPDNITGPVLTGTLLRLSPINEGTWLPRFFMLKQDQCLYFYKTENDPHPVGAVLVAGYNVSKTPEIGVPYSFSLSKKGAISHYYAANSAEKMDQWIKALSLASTPIGDTLLDEDNLKVSPTQIQKPECVGTLCTLVHHKGKAWRRRFCVLKNAKMYFYSDINACVASGMVYLHGYKVQSSTSGVKMFAFELVPPEPTFKHFYFYTDTEMDKKRWLASLEYSIDRWIRVS